MHVCTLGNQKLQLADNRESIWHSIRESWSGMRNVAANSMYRIDQTCPLQRCIF
jgi:hypothetical protein